MDETRRVSDDWLKNWRASIAVKITAAVLYGVIIVGFIVSILALRNGEEKLRSEYAAQADHFTYQIEADLESVAAVSLPEVESAVQRQFPLFHFSAVAATVDQQCLLVGSIPEKAFTLIRKAHINGQALQKAQQVVTLEISLPSPHDAAKVRRNQLLIATGLTTLFFGFFLAWVIRKFITKPFQTLVHATKTVSEGDLTHRLVDNREDEFGYLARFFNQMLDQIMKELTVRQQAQDAVRESEKEMKQILDSIHAGVVVIDPRTHEIVDANDAAIRMIGAPKDRIIGRVCHQFICPTEVGKCPISDLHTTIDNSERALLTAEGGRIPILKSIVKPIVPPHAWSMRSPSSCGKVVNRLCVSVSMTGL